MKMLFVVLAIVFMMVVISAADVCSDGTDGGDCSTTHPGQRCSYGGSVGWVLEDAAKICGCPSGYRMDTTDEEAPGGKCVANVTQNATQNQTQNQTHTNTTQNQTTHTNTTQNQTGAGANATGNQTAGQQTGTNQTQTPSGQGYTTPVDKYHYEDISPKEKIGGLCLFTIFIPLFVVGIALARNR